MDKIRKMFRLVLKNEEEKNFCQACINRPMWDGKIERSFEANTGTCSTCGYVRDKEVIALEKIRRINNEIEELERIIKEIIDSDREIRIDDIVFYRTEEHDTLFRNLGDPACIRKCFQFPVTIEDHLIIGILEEQIRKLERRKENIKQKLPA